MTPADRDKLAAFALGLRIGSKANAKVLTDELFAGEFASLFAGTADERSATLRSWLASLGVAWTSGDVVESVAETLRKELERAKARASLHAMRQLLDQADRALRYPNISWPEQLDSVVKSLNGFTPPPPPPAATNQKRLTSNAPCDVPKPSEPKT